MSDNLRRYRAICHALMQAYPTPPTGHFARHVQTLAALMSGIVGGKISNCPASRPRSPMAATPAAADEVLFLNGDRLTGRIVQAAGGKLVLRTEAAGDITIDLKQVKTFATDEPVQLKVRESTVLKSPVIARPEGGSPP